MVTPDEPSFAAATFGMPAELEPEMVVIAADAADVAVTVRLANRTARRIAVQTSGRQPQAHSSGAGLRTILLVTRLLAAVSIDPTQRTATVGAGSSWRQVIDAAEPFGLAPISGNASGMGALGRDGDGRTGPVGRAFGFAADRVRSYHVVTPGGDLVVIGAEHDPELFRALRAGGGAIVTAMTVDLIAGGQQYAGGLWFSAQDGPAVLHRWQDWVSALPEDVSTSIARLDLPDATDIPEPLRGRSVIHVRFAHLGDPADGARILASMRHAAPTLLDNVRVPSARSSVIDAEPACAGR